MAETVKHTPGPWSAVGDVVYTSSLGDQNSTRDIIATVFASRGGTKEANSLLISVSPDLIEAMKGIEHFSDALNFREDPLSKALRQWIDEGRKAIAKAEGRS